MIHNIISSLFLIFIVGCQFSGTESHDHRVDLPNIVFILADDLGYGDLSCYGQKNFSTPNIDRLASEGMRFTQHYSGSTVCAPSRSVIMTGLHTGYTPIRGNQEVRPEGQHPLPAEAFTLAEMLQKKGYTTGAFGKWGLGFPGSEGDPLKQGFNRFYGYNCQRIAHNYFPYDLWDNDQKVVLEDNEGNREGTYAPLLIQEKTLDFIEENKSKPFFLFVPHVIPHAELKVPQEYMEKFRGKFLPEKHYAGCDPGCEDYKIGGYGTQEESHAAFAGMINLLDEQVGEIIEKINDLGLSENTIILFSSDNGPHLEGGADPDYFDSNGLLRGYKRDLYEGGIRVPLIAKWSGRIPASTVTDHVSAFWDIFPTIADLTTTELQEEVNGISFLPTLLNKPSEQLQHEYLYWEFSPMGGRKAVRQSNWKLVCYDLKREQPRPPELYDLSTDPGEQQDLALSHPEVVQRLLAMMNNRSEAIIERWNF